MRSLSYLKYELLRAVRNGRFFAFSLAFPTVMYLLLAGPNRDVHNFFGTGVSAPLYYMIGLLAFGAMMAMVSSGARIAFERTSGWTRHLRTTPLSPRSYFRAKVLTAYAVALATMGLLYIAGFALGVRIAADSWAQMTGLILVALVPFAALGIFVGHLLNAEAIGPVAGGVVSLLAFVSGTWFPVTSGFLYDVARYLPSYWLVQASRLPVDAQPWGWQGWTVVAVWAVVLTGLARWAYRRDTARV